MRKPAQILSKYGRKHHLKPTCLAKILNDALLPSLTLHATCYSIASLGLLPSQAPCPEHSFPLPFKQHHPFLRRGTPELDCSKSSFAQFLLSSADGLSSPSPCTGMAACPKQVR